MKNENCFGHWCFEDTECMLCKSESTCKVHKEYKEKEYHKQLKIKKNPICENCKHIEHGSPYTYGICKKDLCNYIGNEKEYIRKKCNTKCQCYDLCLTKIFDQNPYIKIKCIKSVKADAYNDETYRYNLIFKKDETYKFKYMGNYLYYMIIDEDGNKFIKKDTN